MSECLGIRGATTADDNSEDAILDATEELLREMVVENSLEEQSVAAVFFTTTTDLNATFPAVAARVRLGWEQTALISSHEIPVPHGTPSVIRVLLLANTDRTKDQIVNVYKKGAQNLRSTAKPKS